MKATGLTLQDEERTIGNPGNGCFLQAHDRKKAATKRDCNAYGKGAESFRVWHQPTVQSTTISVAPHYCPQTILFWDQATP